MDRSLSIEEGGDDNRVSLRLRGTALFDPRSLAMGAPAQRTVWDLIAVSRWSGLARTSGLATDIEPLPALLAGTPGVAYTSKKGRLSVDLCQRLRSVAADGGATQADLTLTDEGFELALPDVAVFGDTSLDVSVHYRPAEVRDESTPLRAHLIGAASRAVLQVSGRPPQGAHELAFETRQGVVRSRYCLTVSQEHLELSILAPPDATTAVEDHLFGRVASWLRRLPQRLRWSL